MKLERMMEAKECRTPYRKGTQRLSNSWHAIDAIGSLQLDSIHVSTWNPYSLSGTSSVPAFAGVLCICKKMVIGILGQRGTAMEMERVSTCTDFFVLFALEAFLFAAEVEIDARINRSRINRLSYFEKLQNGSATPRAKSGGH